MSAEQRMWTSRMHADGLTPAEQPKVEVRVWMADGLVMRFRGALQEMTHTTAIQSLDYDSTKPYEPGPSKLELTADTSRPWKFRRGKPPFDVSDT